MPIYEYRCSRCGAVAEFLEGVILEKAQRRCPSCGGEEMTKILSRNFVARSSDGTAPLPGKTCCGRDERCEAPPCSQNGPCRR